MTTQTRATAHVELIGDDGSSVTATIYTTFTEYKPLDGARQWIPGVRAYKLPNGAHLNPLEDGAFAEVISGKVFRPRNLNP